MPEFETYQKRLMGIAKQNYRFDEKLSKQVERAFYTVPRHKFVDRYRDHGSNQWHVVNDNNLDRHLGTIYSDTPLILKGSDNDIKSRKGSKQISTISQPSFVLRLLDLLDLKEGQTVFELGAGSGWNAALMSYLVGPTGKVFTIEIISELAKRASKKIQTFGIRNVKVISGDAGDGFNEGAPYDRAMFTAGAFDLPLAFHKQIRIGGLLLFVLKCKGNSDTLILLRKNETHFESIYASPCGFVPMTGKYHLPEMEEKDLQSFLKSKDISDKKVESQNFWWGSGTPRQFLWQTGTLRSFLSLFEKNFEAIHSEKEEGTFGWYDPESNSFALATSKKLDAFGSGVAVKKLVNHIKLWIGYGMPTLANLKLRIYPIQSPQLAGDHYWVSTRKSSIFVWERPS